MKADRKTEAEVVAVINRFIETYTRADVEGTLALLAPDPDVTMIGTGADEEIVGIDQVRMQIKRDYSQAGSISIKQGPIAVSAAGTVAWTRADSTWHVRMDGREMTYALRWTMVLEKRNGNWLVVQSHLSAPSDTQAKGQSFPAEAAGAKSK